MEKERPKIEIVMSVFGLLSMKNALLFSRNE